MQVMQTRAKTIGLAAVGLIAFMILAVLVWQGVTEQGVPDPTAGHLSEGAVILNAGILVFREGLEAILVLAAITASMMGANSAYRRPVAIGVGLGLIATIITWFVAIAIIGAVDAPALYIQAVTGVLAIVVLLVVMNWFFHSVYWAGWISHHTKRRQKLLSNADENCPRAVWGFVLLGFTAMYREGFEIVLFLQSLRLQAGSGVVLRGVTIGLVFTVVVGILTFVAHHKLPYKKMLVFTGIMLGAVLIVMVGESAQELQLAGWLSSTTLPLPIPNWMGIWFAIFPTAESLLLQFIAAAVVIGSYVVAQDVRVRRPRRRGETPAYRPTGAPTA